MQGNRRKHFLHFSKSDEKLFDHSQVQHRYSQDDIEKPTSLIAHLHQQNIYNMKKIYTAFVALGLALAANAQIPTNGLIHHYPFDGNATNLIGGTNNGTVIGAVQTTDRLGATNSAYYFDGNAFIRFGAINGLTNLNSFTIAGWYSFDSIDFSESSPESINELFGQRKNGTNAGIFARSYKGKELYAYHIDTLAGIDGFTTANILKTSSFKKWFHFTFVKNGDTIYTVVNGTVSSKKVEGNQPTASSWGSSEFVVGSCDNAFPNSKKLKGKVDDFRIYNRALSLNEINQFYDTTIVACNINSTHTIQGSSLTLTVNSVSSYPAVVYVGFEGAQVIDTLFSGNTITINTGIANPIGQPIYIVDNNECIFEGFVRNGTNSIDNNSFDYLISLYPNPANNVLHISSEITFEKIQITNPIGNIIKEGSLSSTSINITELQAGVYFAKLIDSKGTIATKKFIKQ